MSTPSPISDDQKSRALDLCNRRACPACGRKLTLFELLCMVRGGGFRFHVKATMEDGQDRIIPEGDFDPQTMALLE
jgi:hypothetical protein